MDREKIDASILEAISTLKNEGKSLTAINIKQITNLRLYQIYYSKHNDLLEIKRKRPRHIQPKATPKVELEKSAKTDINLSYILFGVNLAINLKGATNDEIEDAIEDLNFAYAKSIERLQREKTKLQ